MLLEAQCRAITPRTRTETAGGLGCWGERPWRKREVWVLSKAKDLQEHSQRFPEPPVATAASSLWLQLENVQFSRLSLVFVPGNWAAWLSGLNLGSQVFHIPQTPSMTTSQNPSWTLAIPLYLPLRWKIEKPLCWQQTELWMLTCSWSQRKTVMETWDGKGERRKKTSFPMWTAWFLQS